MSRYRLIVTDLDKTLLDDVDRISPQTVAEIKTVKGRGVWFTVATGRRYRAVRPLVKPVSPNAPLILYNGALIVTPDGSRVVYRRAISPQAARRSLRVLREHSLYANVFILERVVTDGSRRSVEQLLAEDGTRPEKISDLMDVLESRDIFKIQALAQPGLLDELIEPVRLSLADGVAIFRSEPYLLEFGPPGVSKGMALEFLVEHLGLAMNETIVIGDSLNDVPMLEAAIRGGGLAFAVANAHEKVLALPGVSLAPANTEDGVAHVIKRHIQGESIDP